MGAGASRAHRSRAGAAHKLVKHATHVIRAANELPCALAGSRSTNTPPVVSNGYP